jgi:probable phosphoglycerate mutase
MASARHAGRLILVRHGESEGNSAQRFSANTEIGLTDLGVAQAREAGKTIASRFAAKRIVSSPFRRARWTSELIAAEIGYGGEIRIEPDLRERSIGELAGQPYRSMSEHPDYVLERFWEWRPAGGESLVDVRDRASRVLARIATAHPDEDVVVVSHGGVMLSLCAHVEGTWNRRRVASNCELIVLIREPEGGLRTTALSDHAAPLASGDDGSDPSETG